MKTVLLITLCAPWIGCASTTIYRSGKPILRIQGDATNLTYRNGGIYFHADKLNHSEPTRAGGSVIGTAGTAATGIVTALAAGL